MLKTESGLIQKEADNSDTVELQQVLQENVHAASEHDAPCE